MAIGLLIWKGLGKRFLLKRGDTPMLEMVLFFLVEVLKTLAKFAVAAGVAYVGYLYYQRKYAGWKAVLLDNGEQKAEVEVVPSRVKLILKDDYERKLYLKSFFADGGGWLNIDVLRISEVDFEKRRFVVYADQNPQKPKPAPQKPESEKVIEWLQQNLPVEVEKAFAAVLEADTVAQKKKKAA
jgi:hypothetical protein